MQFYGLKVVITAVAIAASLMVLPSCSDDDTTKAEASNAISGQDVGIRELKLTMPRMGRFNDLSGMQAAAYTSPGAMTG